MFLYFDIGVKISSKKNWRILGSHLMTRHRLSISQSKQNLLHPSFCFLMLFLLIFSIRPSVFWFHLHFPSFCFLYFFSFSFSLSKFIFTIYWNSFLLLVLSWNSTILKSFFIPLFLSDRIIITSLYSFYFSFFFISYFDTETKNLRSTVGRTVLVIFLKWNSKLIPKWV